MTNNAQLDADAAFTLVKLLGLYCQCQDEWEAHYDRIFNKEYKGAEEALEHARLTAEFTKPLIEKCELAGFRYGHLGEIIAPNFKTDAKKRRRQLDAITAWVNIEYDMEVPF